MNGILSKLDFTFRVIVLITAMTLGVVFLFAGARHALAANLKSTATVTGDVFTVGDLFGGLSREAAAKVLGPAPQPGKDIVLNARTLMRIAIAMDLPWRPAHSSEQVVVRRAATLIDSETIRNALIDRFGEEGIDSRFDISFLNIADPKIVLPQGMGSHVEVAALDYDASSGYFSATLAAPSKQEALQELVLSGKIERLHAVPILKKTLSNGDVINAYDIDWVDVKSRDLQQDIVLSADELVGLTPRRMALAGKPLRANELERPQLVSRGDTVTITYHNGFMTLTAQGKAMQDGAKGDSIRVVNAASNRTVDAFIEDEYVVTVVP